MIIYSFKAHTSIFYEAKELYLSADWSKAIELFEITLKKYLEELESCRLSCEKPFDQGWFPDFVSSVASIYFIAEFPN